MLAIDSRGGSSPPNVSYDGASDSPGAAATLVVPLSYLPVPAPAGGDLGAALALLEVQTGQAERSVATQGRDAEEALAASEAQQEVQALHAEAGSMQSASFWDAGTTFVQCVAGGESTVAGSVVGGAKSLGDGLYGADEKNDEADAKGFEAASLAARTGADDAHDAASCADQLVQSALAFYKEYVATQGQTASVVVRRS